jgi:hypothetical protein
MDLVVLLMTEAVCHVKVFNLRSINKYNFHTYDFEYSLIGTRLTCVAHLRQLTYLCTNLIHLSKQPY